MQDQILYLSGPALFIIFTVLAGIAQLVEHQLPKLRVAGSSLVSRSKNLTFLQGEIFL